MKSVAVLAWSTALIVGACVQPGEPKAGTASGAKPPARSSEAADSSSSGPRPARGARQSAPAAGATLDLCALLTSKDVMDVTGLAVERVERKSDGCEWYANAAAQQEKGAQTARAMFDKLMNEEPKSAEQGVKTLENVMKGIGSAAAPSKPIFAVTINRDDADAGEAILKGTVTMNGGGQPGGGLEPVEGLGDRAFIGAMGMLFYVRKGDTLITIGGMGTRDQTIALARIIVPRI